MLGFDSLAICQILVRFLSDSVSFCILPNWMWIQTMANGKLMRRHRNPGPKLPKPGRGPGPPGPGGPGGEEICHHWTSTEYRWIQMDTNGYRWIQSYDTVFNFLFVSHIFKWWFNNDGCKMIQKNEVINPKCSSTICATTSSFSFKRLQKPSKWRSFRTHSFFLAPRLVPGQPPPDLRGSKSSFHHAMQVWVGSSNLKKRKLYNNVKHMLLMPAGTYVRFLPLVAAFDPAHEGGLQKGPIRPGAQSASAACTNSRLFLVLHAPATSPLQPVSILLYDFMHASVYNIYCMYIYICHTHTQSHMYVVLYIINPMP